MNNTSKKLIRQQKKALSSRFSSYLHSLSIIEREIVNSIVWCSRKLKSTYMPQSWFAKQAGCSRKHVSKTMFKLKDMGIIKMISGKATYYSNIYFLDDWFSSVDASYLANILPALRLPTIALLMVPLLLLTQRLHHTNTIGRNPYGDLSPMNPSIEISQQEQDHFNKLDLESRNLLFDLSGSHQAVPDTGIGDFNESKRGSTMESEMLVNAERIRKQQARNNYKGPRAFDTRTIKRDIQEDPFDACKAILDSLLVSPEGELEIPNPLDKRLKLLYLNPYFKMLDPESQHKMLLAYPWASRWLPKINHTKNDFTLSVQESIINHEDKGTISYDDPEVVAKYLGF